MYRLLSGVESAGQALRRLIPPVGFVSALINTTPIVAMLIPATKELEQQSGIPARLRQLRQQRTNRGGLDCDAVRCHRGGSHAG